MNIDDIIIEKGIDQSDDAIEIESSNTESTEIQKRLDQLNSNLEILKNNSPEDYENLKKVNYSLYRASLTENSVNRNAENFESFNLNVYLANLISMEGDNPYNNCTGIYAFFLPELRASSPSEILMNDLESKEAFKTFVIEYEVLGYTPGTLPEKTSKIYEMYKGILYGLIQSPSVSDEGVKAVETLYNRKVSKMIDFMLKGSQASDKNDFKILFGKAINELTDSEKSYIEIRPTKGHFPFL